MISKMSPEELQKMLQLASSFQGQNSYPTGGPCRPGLVPPNITPGMLKTASDMMSKMPSEELQKIYEMASSLKGKDAVPTAAALDSNGLSSDTVLRSLEIQENFVANGNDAGETSSSNASFSNRSSVPGPNFRASTFDLQEQMRNQMKDLAMRQMFTSMIKNVSPETMASMSEQFGMKLSREDAAKAQQAMSSLSPEHLDKMMCSMDRFQRGVEGTRKAKNWLFGLPDTGLRTLHCQARPEVLLNHLPGMDSHNFEEFDPFPEDSTQYNTQDQDVQLVSSREKVTSPKKTRVTSQRPNNRGGNFSIDEDKTLVFAWLNTSIDATQGTDQKAQTFWTRITQLYNESKGPTHNNRTERSLNSRWSSN